MPDGRFQRLSRALAEHPKPTSDHTFYRFMGNRWWAVDENGDLLFYNNSGVWHMLGAPQCSSIRAGVTPFTKYKDHPAVDVAFIEAAWIPVDLRDWV